MIIKHFYIHSLFHHLILEIIHRELFQLIQARCNLNEMQEKK